jgi:hypothetical protein
MRKLSQKLLILAFATIPVLASAECGPERGHNPPPPQGGPKAPPPIDPELCKGKAVGTSVETKTPDGRSITGTCQFVFLPNRPASDEKPR